MNDEPTFYDIIDQTKYKIVISRPENVAELSDLFISKEELEELTGRYNHFCTAGKEQSITLNEVVAKETLAWAEKLEASSKKTLIIDDEELLDVLTSGSLGDHTPGTCKYGRHGNRICYARRYKRKKTKATLGDLRDFWIRIFPHAFRDKFNCYPSHVPTYDRHLNHFKAFQKILGWKRCRATMYDKEQAKFYRQIWDNPEEFIK